MRALISTWIVCVTIAFTGVAQAAPGVGASGKHQAAVELINNGNANQALVVIEEGLAIAPKDLPLLYLKGRLLLALRDYLGALAAYEAYLNAGATGAPRRAVEEIVKNLRLVKSTSLDITLANGPADIYLDSKTDGVFCTAAPSCNKAVPPGQYKVIAERSGFDRWTGPVTVASGATKELVVTLVEQSSQLTVRVAQPGARVTVDDTAYDAPIKVAAGTHRVVVSLAGHAEVRLEIVAHEGKPVELDVSLTPIIPIRIEPPGAKLQLDGKPVAIADGGLPVPPGAHVLVARAEGSQDGRIEIPEERPADYQIVVELSRLEVVKAVVVPPGPGRFTPRRKLALAVSGVGLLAAAGGVVLGLQSQQLDHDTFALCPSPSIPCSGALEANDLNRRGQSRALEANVAYGVAGGAAIAAAVLWLTGAPESRVAVTPHLGAVAGLDLAVRF